MGAPEDHRYYTESTEKMARKYKNKSIVYNLLIIKMKFL